MYLLVYLVFLTFRHDKNKRRAQEVSEKLRDNRDLQHFLQNTQDVSSPSVCCSCNCCVTWISTLIISLIIHSSKLNITVFFFPFFISWLLLSICQTHSALFIITQLHFIRSSHLYPPYSIWDRGPIWLIGKLVLFSKDKEVNPHKKSPLQKLQMLPFPWLSQVL